MEEAVDYRCNLGINTLVDSYFRALNKLSYALFSNKKFEVIIIGFDSPVLLCHVLRGILTLKVAQSFYLLFH